MFKKNLFHILCILIIVVVFILYLTYWRYEGLGKPSVKSGEFQIYIEYTVDALGEDNIIVIDDVLRCEYRGRVYHNWKTSKYIRVWEYVDSTYNNKSYMVYSDDTIKVVFYPGSASYYMGEDYYSIETNEYSEPKFCVSYFTVNEVYRSIVSIEELKTYGINIINYSIPEPIKNTFK